MNTRISKVVGLLTIMAIVLLATGCCAVAGALRTEPQSVDLGGAESVRVEIEMGAGELKVAGGADELLSADFTYNVAAWKPKIDYSVSGSQGKLIVQQPEVRSIIPLGSIRYEWDLRLGDDVPMDLSVELGAGETYLELGSLSLAGLDIETGAGKVTVDLTGSPSPTRLDLAMGAGEVTVDLTGDWESDLDASIKGGVGKLTLRLPGGVGVRVDVERGIGKINASGLKMDGSDYVNDAYGESEVTLRIDIEAGVGEINLEPAE